MKRYLLVLIAACLCTALVGCATTSEPPRTIEEWMALEQVHP